MRTCVICTRAHAQSISKVHLTRASVEMHEFTVSFILFCAFMALRLTAIRCVCFSVTPGNRVCVHSIIEWLNHCAVKRAARRVVLHIFIGMPITRTFASGMLGAALANVCTSFTGGVTWGTCSGTWVPSAGDPDSHPPFNVAKGERIHNETVWLSIMFPDTSEGEVAEKVALDAIAAHARRNEPGIDYIHVERYRCEARHFRVNDML